MTCKVKVIESLKFMASSISNLPDNLAEGLHKGKCIDCKSCHAFVNVGDGLLPFICSDCKKKL